MDKNSNAYSLTFAAVLCGFLAVLLAGSYEGVKDTVRANEAFDKQRSVLIALGLHEKGATAPRTDLQQKYEKYVTAEILEVKRGATKTPVRHHGVDKTIEVISVQSMTKTDHPIESIASLLRAEGKKPIADRIEYAEFYTRKNDAGEVEGYAIPIAGPGLWSMLRGYLGIAKDKKTVTGITFYSHAETPGLGGEVDNPKWQASWKGKTFMEGDKLVSITLKKGAVIAGEPNADHMVDGLSGATITSDGVSIFLRSDLEKYQTYLKKL